MGTSTGSRAEPEITNGSDRRASGPWRRSPRRLRRGCQRVRNVGVAAGTARGEGRTNEANVWRPGGWTRVRRREAAQAPRASRSLTLRQARAASRWMRSAAWIRRRGPVPPSRRSRPGAVRAPTRDGAEAPEAVLQGRQQLARKPYSSINSRDESSSSSPTSGCRSSRRTQAFQRRIASSLPAGRRASARA